jgi:ligand-binding sensor domain-containing protein/signal transduction histidine kinase
LFTFKSKLKIALYYITFIFALFLSSLVNASEHSIRFEHLTIDNGLPQNSGYSLLRDKIGFIWIGTQEGLVRYDGYNTKIFKHNDEDPNSLSANYIQSITQDRQGNLWVGTKGGLNRFDPKTELFKRYLFDTSNPKSISNPDIRVITEDRQGILWVGTARGLNLFNPITERFTHYRHDERDSNSLSHDSILTIIEDIKGNIWIGTDGGGLNLFKSENNGFAHYRHDEKEPNTISNDNVSVISEDKQGNLWIGTNGGGLNLFDINSEVFTNYRADSNKTNSLSNDDIRSILEDSEGYLWVGTNGGGLNRFNPKTEKFKHYLNDSNNPRSLSNNSVFSIIEDKQSNIWIGTEAGGINRFNLKNENFKVFRHYANAPDSLSENIIMSLIEDEQGDLWVGTLGGGLNHFNSKTNKFHHYRHDSGNQNSISNDHVWAIAEDNTGNIWLGTNNGLNRFNPKTKKNYHYRHDINNLNSLSNDFIFAITVDNKDNLWIGTKSGGLNYFNTKTEQFSHFQHDVNDANSLSHDDVMVIMEDSKGKIWVGTFGGGLNSFNPKTGKFDHYKYNLNDPKSLSIDSVYSITEDSKGNLWVGTTNGLNLLDKKTGNFKRYQVKDGLPNNIIYRIEEDNDGWLWLSTNLGLSRFHPESKIINNYNVGDGLQSNEFNQGASLKSKNGELYFGGIKGYNRFLPKDITADLEPPILVFTDMLLSNKPVPVINFNQTSKNNHETIKNSLNEQFTLEKAIHSTSAIILTNDQNLVTFEFSTLHFTNPKKNQYSYQLKGWDDEWINTDYKNRRATYTNLPSGNYVLRVKASNPDGVWNEGGASLKITVLPPLWLTWWAYLIYGVIFLSVVLIFVRAQRQKVNNARALSQQFEQKVIERTAELQDKNKELAQQKTQVEEKNNEILAAQQQLIQSSKMASLGTMTAGVAHEINNPTNFTYAAVYMMRDEIKEIKAFLKQLAGGNNADPDVLNSFDDKFNKLIELTQTATEGTNRIKIIVEDLRTLARLDDAKKAIVNLSELLISTVHLVRTQYDRIEIETQLEFDPEITCFPSKLNQVFMNILVNACQAVTSRQESDKNIEGKIIITSTEQNNNMELSFKDNGLGMDQKTLQRICDPFFTTKDVGTGTGLGMAISFGIIEEHGGMLKVTSVIGEGSVISVNIPLNH